MTYPIQSDLVDTQGGAGGTVGEMHLQQGVSFRGVGTDAGLQCWVLGEEGDPAWSPCELRNRDRLQNGRVTDRVQHAR